MSDEFDFSSLDSPSSFDVQAPAVDFSSQVSGFDANNSTLPFDPINNTGGFIGGVSDPLAGGLTQNPNGTYSLGGGGVLGGIAGLLGNKGVQSLLGIGGGIYGLSQGNALQQMAQTAFGQANPFGAYRPQYAQQLAALEANPSLIASDPGYQFDIAQGNQSVQRTMAKEGYLGSGNEAIALQQYGQQFANQYLQQEEDRLAGLAGANIAPNFGPAMTGFNQGANINSGALNSALYGPTMYGLNQGGGLMGAFPTSGGASAGTPASGGFNSAGGEAATIGSDLGLLKAGTLLGNKVSQWSGSGTNDTLSTVNQVAGLGADALGIYTGLQQGGVLGYGKAAADIAKGISTGANLLGDSTALTDTLGTVGGYVAAPLSLYSAVANWQSGNTAGDALRGAEAGASIGSIIPGVGTLIGGVIGGALGAASSAFGPGKVDPENASFNGFTKAYNSAGSNASQLANSVQDPYTVLAGYFDLRSNQMGPNNPLYTSYGRMGEQKFTNDLISKVQSAQQSGITDPSQMWSQVVQPWINSFGNWSDPNKNAMMGLLQNMTGQVMSGSYQQNFKAVGGDTPFAKQVSPQGSASNIPSNITNMAAYRSGAYAAPRSGLQAVA